MQKPKKTSKKTKVDKIAESLGESVEGGSHDLSPTQDEPKEKHVISKDFDALADSIRQGLEHFRTQVNELSMKQLKRALIAVIEHPLEQTVEVPETGPEAEIINLGRMINYSKFRLSLEMLNEKLRQEKEQNEGEKNEQQEAV